MPSLEVEGTSLHRVCIGIGDIGSESDWTDNGSDIGVSEGVSSVLISDFAVDSGSNRIIGSDTTDSGLAGCTSMKNKSHKILNKIPLLLQIFEVDGKDNKIGNT